MRHKVTHCAVLRRSPRPARSRSRRRARCGRACSEPTSSRRSRQSGGSQGFRGSGTGLRSRLALALAVPALLAERGAGNADDHSDGGSVLSADALAEREGGPSAATPRAAERVARELRLMKSKSHGGLSLFLDEFKEQE